MFKRLGSLILALVISAAAFPAFASSEAADEKSLIASDERIDLVLQLGLFEKDGEGKYNFDNAVTRGEFAVILYNILSYRENGHTVTATAFSDVKPWNIYAAEIQYLYNYGLVIGDGEGNFNPDEPVTAEQVYRVLLCAANYGQVINTSQSAVMNTAANTKISAGVSLGADSTVSVYDLVRIIYNFLDVIVVDYKISADGISGLENGDVVSERFMDLKKITGIVYSDSHISIINEQLGDGAIDIDGRILNTGDKDYCDYVGYYVTAYYSTDNDVKESLTAISKSVKKNKTLTVEAEDIEGFDGSKYYYCDESGSRKSLTIKNSLTALYNYEALYGQEQYVPQNGSVTFISNDGDNAYDILFVEDYDDYIVKSVDTANNRLIVSDEYADKQIILPMDSDNIMILDSNKNQAVLSDMQTNSVISVPKNYENKQFAAKYICSDRTVSGILSSISDEGNYLVMTIGGDEYRGSALCRSYALYRNSEVTARLNFRGIVAAIDNGGGAISGDYRYGYVIRAKRVETDDGEEAYQIKLLDQGGGIYILECDEKTRIDGVKADYESLGEVFFDSDKNMTKRQPIRYKTGNDGTIRYIDAADSGSGGEYNRGTTDNCLLMRVEGMYLYKANTRTFKRLISGDAGEAILDDNVVVFNVPPRESSRTYDDDQFKVISAGEITPDEYCTFQAYNTDRDRISMNMCVVYNSGGTSFSTRDQAAMIQKIKEIYDDEVGITYEITALHNGTQSVWVASEPDIFTDEKGQRLNPGDVIRVITDSDGYVTAVEIMFSKSSGSGMVNINNEIYGGAINSDFRLSYGNPYRVQDGNMQLTYDVAASGDEYFRIGGAPIYVYDSSLSSGKVYQGSIGDIWETKYGYDNKVLVQQFQTSVSQVFVIK